MWAVNTFACLCVSFRIRRIVKKNVLKLTDKVRHTYFQALNTSCFYLVLPDQNRGSQIQPCCLQYICSWLCLSTAHLRFSTDVPPPALKLKEICQAGKKQGNKYAEWKGYVSFIHMFCLNLLLYLILYKMVVLLWFIL